MKIFLMKSESFLDSNTTNTFKAQKGIVKNIKIIHVTSVVQQQCYEPMRILFMHKENQNNNFIQQFLLLPVRKVFLLNLWCHIMDYLKKKNSAFLGLERVRCVAVSI